MMKIEINYNNRTHTAFLNEPIDISIPLKNGEENPNCFWAEPVVFETISDGDFIGSVAEGGSVNYKKVIITPHGNGTHTECYGHISSDVSGVMTNSLSTFHFMAQIISLPLTIKTNGDAFISFETFVELLNEKHSLPEAIVLRTLPNTEDKLNKRYSGKNPPYLDPKITEYLCDKNVNHLLIDLPSVDKEVDGGALAAHKKFWNMDSEVRKTSTITELIYVPNSVVDGLYLLNLQIPSMELDAVPSKPVLYKLF